MLDIYNRDIESGWNWTVNLLWKCSFISLLDNLDTWEFQ